MDGYSLQITTEKATVSFPDGSIIFPSAYTGGEEVITYKGENIPQDKAEEAIPLEIRESIITFLDQIKDIYFP